MSAFVALHLKLGLGRIRLTKLTPVAVRIFLSEKEQSGLSTRTVTMMRDVLRIALNQAVSDGAVARNVAVLVKRPKPSRRQGPVERAPPAAGRRRQPPDPPIRVDQGRSCLSVSNSQFSRCIQA